MTTPATREEVVILLARAIAQHVGPLAYDDMPADKCVVRQLVREGSADINDFEQDSLRDLCRDALTALEQHGLALVPVEATEAMIDGADKALNAWRQGLPADEKMLRRKFVHGAAFTEATVPEKHAIRYRAMLAASPYNKETGNG